jgi:hypothetical protein
MMTARLKGHIDGRTCAIDVVVVAVFKGVAFSVEVAVFGVIALPYDVAILDDYRPHQRIRIYKTYTVLG